MVQFTKLAKKKLSKKDIQHLAKLSALKLSGEEVEKLGGQLEETIEYVKNLSELDTDNVEPTSHTVDLKNISFLDGTQSPRTLPQEAALKNAKETRDGLFATKRVLGGNEH